MGQISYASQYRADAEKLAHEIGGSAKIYNKENKLHCVLNINANQELSIGINSKQATEIRA